MALSPHAEDKNRDDVKKHIRKLQKEDTAQATEQLKTEFNMDEGEGGKSKIVKPNKS